MTWESLSQLEHSLPLSFNVQLTEQAAKTGPPFSYGKHFSPLPAIHQFLYALSIGRKRARKDTCVYLLLFI